MNYNTELINLLLRMIAEIPIREREEILDQVHPEILDEQVREQQKGPLLERLIWLPPEWLAKVTAPNVVFAILQFLETEGLVTLKSHVKLTEFHDQAHFWWDALPRYLIDSQYNLTKKGIDELHQLIH